MSTTAEITVAPLPTTEEVAFTLLSWMFSTTGVVTDANIGSIIRTYSEAIGSVNEIEGITAQAQAVQAMVYSAYSVFNISPLLAKAAVGTVTFSTLSSAPLPTGQSVLIPAGAIVQTTNGIQFTTTSNTTLVSGTVSINAPVQAVFAGAQGNVATNTVVQIATGLTYPLAVNNASPLTGGINSETASQTLARFLATVSALGRCTPLAVASSVIGVSFGQESVQYSTCLEPWIAQVIGGDPNPTPGFQVAVDNGSGAASGNLLATVNTYLSNGPPVGFRPAGVPYSVIAVVPVNCSVVVIGTSMNSALDTAIQVAVSNSILSYFSTLNFGDTAELTQLIAAIANVTIGQLTSLSVTLLDGSSVSQTQITATPSQRVILTGSSVTIN